MGRPHLKNWLKVLITSLILFILSLVIYKNDICCMYSSIRAYGFPGHYLILVKNTDSWQEAQKVTSLTSKELITQGWKLKLGTHTESPISYSPIFNLIFNLAICLLISSSLFFLVKRIKNRKRNPKQ